MIKKLSLLYIVILATLLSANEKVSLQLKWLHQFQFAGYYMAKEKGFYDEVGLDVEIKERDLRYNNIEQVVAGESEYGVSDSILLLYRMKGEPVVIVSPIFQHSPNVLLTLKNSGIDTPFKLENRDITFYQKDIDGFGILSMLKSLNIEANLNRDREKQSYHHLINRGTDAFPSYLTNEPYYFKEKGIEVNIFNPANYGFDFYGDMLFTNSREAEKHPDRVERFREASIKGWYYALNNKREAIDIIKKKYAKNKKVDHLTYEAEALEQIILHKYIPIGTIDKGRIEFIISKYREFNLTDSNSTITGDYIFEESRSGLELTTEEKSWLKHNSEIELYIPFNIDPLIVSRYDGTNYGIIPDFLKEIEKNLNNRLSIKLTKDENSFNNSHGVVSIFNTDSANEKFLLTEQHTETPFIIFVNRENSEDIKNLKDLDGKKVAVLDFAKQSTTIISQRVENIEIIEVKSPKEQMELLQYKEVDAIIGFANYHYLISKMMFSNIKPAFNTLNSYSQHIGIKKEHKVLYSILDKAIKFMGDYRKEQIIAKWLKAGAVDNRQFLTREEKSYLQKKKSLKVCVDPDWMPFEKITDGGEYIGMSSDYIKLLEKEIGIPINLKPTKTWLESLKLGRERECDIFSLVMPTKKRREYLQFSTPYIKAPIVIVTTQDKFFINSIKQVADKKLGVVKGYAYAEILREQYPELNLITVDTLNDGLEKVNQGEIFGFIATLPTAGYHIQQNFLGELKIAGKFPETWNLGIGTRNDEPQLLEIFNKAISNIDEETKLKIFNKWVSINYTQETNYLTIFKWVGIVILFFSIPLIIFYRSNRKLNREMDRRRRVESKLKSYMNLVDKNIVSSTTDLNGKITDVSTAFIEVSGFSREELIGNTHSIIRDESIPDEFYADIWNTIEADKTWSGEIQNRSKDGKIYWMKAFITPMFDENGIKVGYTAMRQNITNKKLLEKLSITDELTDLYNRRYFNRVFKNMLNSTKRDNEYIGFAIIDIDHFKQYNDIYGHQKGDEILKIVGKTLKESLHRADDYAFRLGGEEFGILFRNIPPKNGFLFVDKIREKIERLQIRHKGNSASEYLTASFGLLIKKSSDIETVEQIYKNSDDLLYVAKERGRNIVILNSNR